MKSKNNIKNDKQQNNIIWEKPNIKVINLNETAGGPGSGTEYGTSKPS